MGVDLYLNSVWEPWWANNKERLLNAANTDATSDVSSISAAATEMYDEMRASGGYFRNGYNSGDVMCAMAFPGPVPSAACWIQRATCPSSGRVSCSP
jgi:hypothetical protein